MEKTTYAKIGLPSPLDITQGGYVVWAEEAYMARSLELKDTKFVAPVELSIEVPDSFKGSLVMLVLWVERFLRERKIIGKQAPVLAVASYFSSDVDELAICVFDRDFLVNSKKKEGDVAA